MRIGLTGGIASGKSTVAKILNDENIPVIDADEVSRLVMQTGSPLFFSIIEAFGKTVLNSQGELDRVALGEKVFSDPQALESLNHLTHPVIWSEIERQLLQLEKTHPLVVVMVPLLLENGRQDSVDEVWLVSVTPEIQKARLMVRNQLTATQAEARIAAQMPLEDKIKLAHRVIDNSGNVQELRQALLQLLNQLDLS